MTTSSRRRSVIIGLAVVVVAALLGGYLYVHRHKVNQAKLVPPSVGTLETSGGTAWNADQTVGVRVPASSVAGPVSVAFAAPTSVPDEAPISQLLKPLAPAVDIKPQQTPKNAEVVFKVSAPASGPTLANAGLEVFNENLRAWIPLQTRLEDGNLLVAKAPHFSLYRPVILNNIGRSTLNLGRQTANVSTVATTTPFSLVGQIGLSLVTDFYRNLTGTFDESKFKCQPRNDKFVARVSEDRTYQNKFGVCVVKIDADNNRLTIKNGLAVPFKFTPHGQVPGLDLELSDDGDIIDLTRNLMNFMGGRLSVSGLEVGTMRLSKSVSKSFQINGQLSWTAAIFDIAFALASAVVPMSKTVSVEARTLMVRVQQELTVASRGRLTAVGFKQTVDIVNTIVKQDQEVRTAAGGVTFLLSIANCALHQGDKPDIRNIKQLAKTIAGVVQDCLDVAIDFIKASEFKNAIGSLSGLVGSSKVFQETGQTLGAGLISVILNDDAGRMTFSVRQGIPALDVFVHDDWAYQCGDADTRLMLRPDYTGQLTTKYPLNPEGPSPVYQTSTMKFHAVVDGNRPTLIVDTDSSDEPLKRGTKLRMIRSNGGNELDLARDQDQGVWQTLYRNGAGVC